MLRRLLTATAYLLLAGVALAVASVLQTVLSVAILQDALDGTVNRLSALGTLAAVWLAFGLLSFLPLRLARRHVPHLTTLARAPVLLGLGGFVMSALTLVKVLPGLSGGATSVTIGTSALSNGSTVLILGAVVLHLIVTFRMARAAD